jgi:hypothetical protein
MKVKCLVAGTNASGSPDFFPVVIECTIDEYNNGDHYETAKALAESEGYTPKLVIDERDDGFEIVDITSVDWSTASLI